VVGQLPLSRSPRSTRGSESGTRPFEWLDRAYAQRDSGFQVFASNWFFFGSLQSDPRYAALLKKLDRPVPN
jgi:hypothetical protein